MKKFTALFLVFSLMMLSVNLYAKERRGAKFIITKKDRRQIEGELITVKPLSLLLLDTEGKDVSVDIADIKVIRIVKKSKVWTGAGLGLLIGAGSGGLYGLSTSRDPMGGYGVKAGLNAIYWAPVFATLGILIGGFFGAVAGIDKTIQIEGRHPSSIEFILKELRKKARIRDYK
jgi:hypothetical protein